MTTATGMARAAEAWLTPWRAGRVFDLALHALVVAAVALAFTLTRDAALTLAFSGALVLALYLFLAAKEAARAPLLLSPLSFYFTWYAVGLGAGALFHARLVSEAPSVGFSLARVPAADLAQGYVLFLVGSLALHAGVQLLRPTVAEPLPRAAPGAIAWTLAIAAWLVGLWALTNPAWALRLGFPARVLQWLPHAGLALAALLGPRRLGISRSAFAVVLAAGTLLLALVSFLTGSKAIVVFALVPAGWALLLHRRARVLAPVALVLVAALYLGVIAPTIALDRSLPVEEGESRGEHVLRAATLALQGESAPPRNGWNGAEQFLSRMFDPIALGYLVGEVEDAGHLDGASMRYSLTSLVPRALWPEKPTVTQGAWFSYYVGFARSPEEATTSLGITATGELWWNYGLAGLAAGMLLIGACIGTLWRVAGADPRTHLVSMLLYVHLMLNMPNMAEAVSTLVSLLGLAIILGTLVVAFSWRRARRAGRPAP